MLHLCQLVPSLHMIKAHLYIMIFVRPFAQVTTPSSLYKHKLQGMRLPSYALPKVRR